MTTARTEEPRKRASRLPNPAPTPQVPANLRLKPSEEPFTVRRLRNIKPGETVRYYRGAMADLGGDATPRHNAILHQVFAVAQKLEQQGKVLLGRDNVEMSVRGRFVGAADIKFTLTDFVAIGLGTAGIDARAPSPALAEAA